MLAFMKRFDGTSMNRKEIKKSLTKPETYLFKTQEDGESVSIPVYTINYQDKDSLATVSCSFSGVDRSEESEEYERLVNLFVSSTILNLRKCKLMIQRSGKRVLRHSELHRMRNYAQCIRRCLNNLPVVDSKYYSEAKSFYYYMKSLDMESLIKLN